LKIKLESFFKKDVKEPAIFETWTEPDSVFYGNRLRRNYDTDEWEKKDAISALRKNEIAVSFFLSDGSIADSHAIRFMSKQTDFEKTGNKHDREILDIKMKEVVQRVSGANQLTVQFESLFNDKKRDIERVAKISVFLENELIRLSTDPILLNFKKLAAGKPGKHEVKACFRGSDSDDILSSCKISFPSKNASLNKLNKIDQDELKEAIQVACVNSIGKDSLFIDLETINKDRGHDYERVKNTREYIDQIIEGNKNSNSSYAFKSIFQIKDVGPIAKGMVRLILVEPDSEKTVLSYNLQFKKNKASIKEIHPEDYNFLENEVKKLFIEYSDRGQKLRVRLYSAYKNMKQDPERIMAVNKRLQVLNDESISNTDSEVWESNCLKENRIGTYDLRELSSRAVGILLKDKNNRIIGNYNARFANNKTGLSNLVKYDKDCLISFLDRGIAATGQNKALKVRLFSLYLDKGRDPKRVEVIRNFITEHVKNHKESKKTASFREYDSRLPVKKWEVGITFIHSENGNDQIVKFAKARFGKKDRSFNDNKLAADKASLRDTIDNLYEAYLKEGKHLKVNLETRYEDKDRDIERVKNAKKFIQDSIISASNNTNKLDDKDFGYFTVQPLKTREVGVTFLTAEDDIKLGSCKIRFESYKSTIDKAYPKDLEILTSVIRSVRSKTESNKNLNVQIDMLQADQTLDPKRINVIEKQIDKDFVQAKSGDNKDITCAYMDTAGKRDVRVSFYICNEPISRDGIEEGVKDINTMKKIDSLSVYFPPHWRKLSSSAIGDLIEKMGHVKRNIKKEKYKKKDDSVATLNDLVIVMQKSKIKNTYQLDRVKWTKKLIVNYFRYGASTPYFSPNLHKHIFIENARRPDGENALKIAFMKLAKKAVSEPSSLHPLGTTKKQTHVNHLTSFTRIHSGLHEAMNKFIEKLKKEAERKAAERSKEAKRNWRPVDVIESEMKSDKKKVEYKNMPKYLSNTNVCVTFFRKIGSKGKDILSSQIIRYPAWYTNIKHANKDDLKNLKKNLIKARKTIVSDPNSRLGIQLEVKNQPWKGKKDRVDGVEKLILDNLSFINQQSTIKMVYDKKPRRHIRKPASQRTVVVTFFIGNEFPTHMEYKYLNEHNVTFSMLKHKLNKEQRTDLQEMISECENKVKSIADSGNGGKLYIQVEIADKFWMLNIFDDDFTRIRNVKRFIEAYLEYGKIIENEKLEKEAEDIFDSWLRTKIDRDSDKSVTRNAGGYWWDRFEELLQSLEGPFIGYDTHVLVWEVPPLSDGYMLQYLKNS